MEFLSPVVALADAHCQPHVRRFAHCEYGECYIVFDRRDRSKEVWRRSSDYSLEEASNIVPESSPSTLNSEYDALKTTFDPNTITSNRGHFQPWAHLRHPEVTRAFRFSYPTLGVAALNTVYLWDVRTGALAQTIDNTQFIWNEDEDTDAGAEPILGNINYIEVSPQYVFLCGIYALRVFSRQTGRCVLDWPSSQDLYGQWWYGLSLEAPVFQPLDLTSRQPSQHSTSIPTKWPSIFLAYACSNWISPAWRRFSSGSEVSMSSISTVTPSPTQKVHATHYAITDTFRSFLPCGNRICTIPKSRQG